MKKHVALLIMFFSCLLSRGQEATAVFSAGENGVDTYRIPAIIQAKDGSLLAFAEARWESRSDNGNIDLVMKRSTDGGRSWSKAVTVWDDADNVCGNPSPVVDRKSGRIILLACWNSHDGEYMVTHDTYEGRKVFVIFSDDNGLTWSKPREITDDVKMKHWKWYATGPCHAIQLRSGRIVVPCNHGVYPSHDEMGTRSHVIYSDDCGETWHIGGDAHTGNESTVTELSNGDIMLNMRLGRPADRAALGNCRVAAISRDGGLTFGPYYYDKALTEPVCNGAICNGARKPGRPGSKLFFTNPSDTKKRRNMTLKMSLDDGSTWKTVLTVHEGPAAYSDVLTMRDGTVGVLFENGESLAYERISFLSVR